MTPSNTSADLRGRLRAASKGHIQATPGGYYGICGEALALIEQLVEALEKAAPFVGWASTRGQIVAGVDAGELCDVIDALLASLPHAQPCAPTHQLIVRGDQVVCGRCGKVVAPLNGSAARGESGK